MSRYRPSADLRQLLGRKRPEPAPARLTRDTMLVFLAVAVAGASVGAALYVQWRKVTPIEIRQLELIPAPDGCVVMLLDRRALRDDRVLKLPLAR